MEAATPLRQPHVRVLGDRVAVDGLLVEDECAVRLVREREQNGDDPVKTVLDAVEIGARVLDREQAGANAEFVKTEFEKAATELNSQFTDRAREVAEFFNTRVDQVFGPENGQLQRELEKLFSDGSATSVQNRVRELVQETMARSREDLIKQFSAADGANPLADFKAGTIRVLEAVGDLKEATGKVGDVVVAIDACNGPARGRVVFEAKDRKSLSGAKALKELDEAIAERSADFAVMVVPGDDRMPAKMEPLREYNGDKLLVAFDLDAGPLPLEVAYRLARARVLMKRSDAEGIDAAAVTAVAERALAALSEERKVKQQLTGAKTSIDKAYEHVDSMSARVRGLLQEIDALVRPAEDDAAA